MGNYLGFGLNESKIDSLKYYNSLIGNPKKDNDLVRAYQFFNRKKNQAIKLKKGSTSAYYLLQMARVDYNLGFYNDSEELAVRSLDLINIKDGSAYSKSLLKSVYNHLGKIYREQVNTDKAIAIYGIGLKKAETLNDSIILINNISNVYKDLGDYNRAKIELVKAKNLIFKSKDSLIIALVLDNLGYINSKLSIDGSINYMNEALEIRKHLKNESKIYTSYNHIANYYKDLNDSIQAKKYAFKAYNIANKINSLSYKRDALSLLIELKQNNYALLYKKLNDSFYNIKQRQENKFALMKYDVSKKQKELEKSQRTKERVLLITVFLILVFILVFLYLKSKHKKEKIQQVLNTEIRISKKVHDEVANDLYKVMTKLQSSNNEEQEIVLDNLEDIYNKTRDISRENSSLDVNNNYHELINDLLISYQNNNVSVFTRNISKVNWGVVSRLKKITLYRVLQELMTNMSKHSKATNVVLVFNQHKSKIEVDYRDNGNGCTLLEKQNGLLNVENRINSIKGNVIFESEKAKGFKVKITI